MNNDELFSELRRLNFEDFLLAIIIVLALINMYGDYNDKEYVKTHDKTFQKKSNLIFEFTLIITFFIYLYYLSRNYKFYKKAKEEEKDLYLIKVLGSSFLLVGVILLIYFQEKQKDFIGSPAI